MKRISANIDKIAKYDFDNNKVFGSCYLVYKKGEVIEKCLGHVSANSLSHVTNKTIFRIASMTKPITAVATMILVDKGLLSPDDSIDKYLPQCKKLKIIDYLGKVSTPKQMPTIKHILTHTSGIGCDPRKVCPRTPADKITLDAAIDYFIRRGIDFEPGSRVEYSGTGAFDFLQKIIVTITGEDYLKFLEREIFIPCDMPDTTYLPNEEQEGRIIDMHQKQDGKNAVYDMPKGCIFEDFPKEHYLAGAGLLSTLHDYSNFAKMLLNKGEINGKRILSQESVKLLSTPQIPKELMPVPSPGRWGLGVKVIADDTHPTLPKGVFGWSGAYGSHFWVDPENEIYAVFMKNSRFDGGSSNESSINFEKAVYQKLQ